MTRPSVAIIVGACAVLAAAMTIRHFRGSAPTNEADAARARVAALTGKAFPERGGWSAREEGAALPDSGSGGTASRGAAGGAGTVPGPQGFGDARHQLGAEASGGRGATVIAGERAAGGSVGFSGSSRPAGAGNSIRVGDAPDAAVRFAERSRSSDVVREQGAVNPNLRDLPQKGGSQTDTQKPQGEDAPVLSLSFDKTIEPETGESPVVAQNVTFDSGAGAKFATDAQFAIPNGGGMVGQSGTISFDIQPEWSGDDSTDASLAKLRNPNQWENRIEITKNGPFLRFVFTDNSGEETGAGVRTSWQPGETHQVTAAWDEQYAYLFIDGNLAGQAAHKGQFEPSAGAPLYIGSDFPGGQPGAQGSISNFKVYDRARFP